MADSWSDLGHVPDPDAVDRTARFVDALAAGQPPVCGDVGDEALAGLLGAWRDELRSPPATGLVPQRAALHAGAPPPRWRGLVLIGAAAATVLAVGGLGGMVAGAHPGDALYSMRTTLFGEPEHLRDERITLSAKSEMDNIQQMITQGQWDQAQERLTALTDTVATVNDAQRKQDLVDQVNLLNARVAQRDPNATPSGAPTDSGIPVGTAPNTPVTLLAPTAASTSTGNPPPPAP